MSRWHDSSCRAPNVVVDGHIPYCQQCERRCPATLELLSNLTDGNKLPSIPQDEPSEKMNLWWPRNVPYTQAPARERNFDSGDRPTTEDDDESGEPTIGPDSPLQTTPNSSSNVYRSTLLSDEFRLACLAPATKENFPVHITLENYKDDNHPEYGATSYTWGGEDGNSSLSHPIYVGPYWDVLLQSKNCWEMLRFLRPWRGVRMVWVDAVCINQNDWKERGSQVAKMRQIYEGCSRVIVYLGLDIIATSVAFPPSQSLHEFKEDKLVRPLFPTGHAFQNEELGLRQLLQRRYFSRVWVIQELIVSKRAVMRIGDINFQADNDSWTKTIGSDPDQLWDWGATAAPWIRYLAQKAFPTEIIRDVYSLASLTSQSHASDLRDRLFGVIGLLEDKDLRDQFPADYSLSYQHFCIGFFAYCLLKSRKSIVLTKCQGLIAEPFEYPTSSTLSWVPDCKSPESWHGIFKDLRNPSISDVAKMIRDFILPKDMNLSKQSKDSAKSVLITAFTPCSAENDLFVTRPCVRWSICQ